MLVIIIDMNLTWSQVRKAEAAEQQKLAEESSSELQNGSSSDSEIDIEK